MRRIEVLNRKIEKYLEKEQLLKSREYAALEKPYITKSRKNFAVANLLFKVSENEDLKKALSLASGFEMYDWVIIVSYYAMYTSALAAIAKLSFKSKSHAATIALLERFYVQKNGRDIEHLYNVENFHQSIDWWRELEILEHAQGWSNWGMPLVY